MSQEQNGQNITLPAYADYSSSQYRAMVVNTSGQAQAAGADVVIAGILQNKPGAQGRGACVRTFGSTKFQAGTGGVTAGDTLCTESGGKLITAVTGNHRVAISLETVAADGIGECLLLPAGATFSLGQGAYAEVAISNAELLALYTTSKELVAAPGAGYVLELLSAVLIMDHGGTDFTTNGDVTIQTGTTGTAQSDTVAAADWMQASADAIRNVQVLSADIQMDENESLVLACATGNPAAGDGVARVKIRYAVHATGL